MLLATQNTVPSLTTVSGGAPSARFSRAMRAAGRPGAALAGRGRAERRRRRAPSRARTSAREPVEQRHGQRAPFDDERSSPTACGASRPRRDRAARSTPVSTNRPPLRYSARPGQAVDVGHRDAGRLQRLDQRIGEPLRQLVQRHEPARRVVASTRRDAASSRRAATPPSVQSRRPDRARDGRSSAARIARRGKRAAFGLRRQMVEQPAGPRPSARANTSGLAATAAPSRRSSAARPSSPTSGLPARDLEAARERLAGQRRQRRGVGPQRVGRVGRERAGARTCRGSRAPAPRSGRYVSPLAASR